MMYLDPLATDSVATDSGATIGEAVRSTETCPIVLCPQTFASTYAQREHDSTVRSLLQPNGPLFVCKEPGHTFFGSSTVWIIDGDDTLWEDNVHYEALAAAFASHIVERVGAENISASQVRKLLDDVEHEIIPLHGFGPLGFELSLKECFIRLRNRFGSSIEEPIELFSRVIPLLSGVPYEIDNTIAEALRVLRARGDGLVLFTQGPCDIQQGKIARSGLSTIFHVLAVGSNKSPDTYGDLLRRLEIRADQAVVVGNSLRSEVEPALKLGLRAVHYLNPNSWHIVNKSSAPRDKYTEVKHLSELIGI